LLLALPAHVVYTINRWKLSPKGVIMRRKIKRKIIITVSAIVFVVVNVVLCLLIEINVGIIDFVMSSRILP